MTLLLAAYLVCGAVAAYLGARNLRAARVRLALDPAVGLYDLVVDTGILLVAAALGPVTLIALAANRRR